MALKLTKKDFDQSKNEIVSYFLKEGFQPKPSNDINISNAYSNSQIILNNYATLDWKHIQYIKKILKNISEYGNDNTRTRPLNIIMVAEPGSGKSHFVSCLAKELKYLAVSPVVFNLSNIENKNDFILAVDSVRNLKVKDKLPMLFLDEFDTPSFDFSKLLPLMWDGEIHIRDSILKLGKLIIILAGSSGEIEETINLARTMQISSAGSSVKKHKLIDLLSRINGGIIKIPSIDIVEGERNRKVDKICIAISLLKNRFGSELKFIPWRLLKFISEINFRYNVRSMAYLIDSIPADSFKVDKISSKSIGLPFNKISDLIDHNISSHILTKKGPQEVVKYWLKYDEIHNLVEVG